MDHPDMHEGLIQDSAIASVPEHLSRPLPNLPHISDDQIDALTTAMNTKGIGVLPGYIGADQLAHLQAFVEQRVAGAGGEYVGLIGKAAHDGTMLGDITDQPRFIELLHRVYEAGARRKAPDQSIYQVLRCLKGNSGLRHSLIFHYDSYVITALLPIIIPSEGNAGHLVMWPNSRGIRSSYPLNMIDKILLDNKLTQRLLGYLVGRGGRWLKKVAMVPGNLYFFYGYRTIHANEACDPDKIRATALFHFGDPHAESAIRHFTGKAKVRANSAGK